MSILLMIITILSLLQATVSHIMGENMDAIYYMIGAIFFLQLTLETEKREKSR
jgi:hypothetical protein